MFLEGLYIGAHLGLFHTQHELIFYGKGGKITKEKRFTSNKTFVVKYFLD